LYGCGSGGTTTAAPAPAATQNIVELAQATADLSNLTALLVAHGLVDTLSGPGPFTVFAPTNEAFAAAADVIANLTDDQITEVLTYHVVPAKATASDLSQGESLPTVFTAHNLTVDTITPDVTIKPDGVGAADAKVITPNVMATNGVVHIVNAVLVPNLATPSPAPPVATQNIVELAQATPALSNLTALLVAHGLVDTLSGAGPFTVFAPTNDAFAAAADVIAGLTDDQITQVLTYHVVPAEATASDLTQGESLPTVFTAHNLTVDTITPDVTIKPDGQGAADAKVITPNVMATNGVVHVVDAVLVPDLPPALNVQIV